MSISALPTRGDHLQLSFSICSKRGETLALHPVLHTLSPVSPKHVRRLLLLSSQLYLNDRRAKRKHDFPSRGQ
jgi:hypothetical protein